ncbi:lysoplasmalogenase [Phyllobacterium myrsinacearum]|uniref:Putative membrane protein YhhN n=1 Tax=Phyllobacterium myrsinacearum TaxID=28101 RepID=A0A839EGW2_9HYPH|nr:lysoplasmalogenase [Phyllobacterium myrsinacearum]MBA8877618.1 putative membrane protein YhhN [Phyllobacterium myrsinacearum]
MTTRAGPNVSPTLRAVFLIAAVAAIVSALSGADWRWMHYISKPLATALLLLMAVQTANPISKRYQWAIAAGLVFSLFGDIFLMVPQDLFVAGLICFLITHCAYLIALTSNVRIVAVPVTFVACAVLALGIVWGLWSSLPPELRIPVTVYAAVLALMGAQAISRAQQLATGPARLAAIGGILFLASDTLLAYGKFRFAIPLGPLWVLTTYYAAQWFIARSVARTE